MGAIFMHIDAFDLLAIDITAQVRAFVDYQDPLALLSGEKSERSPKQARADNEIIVTRHINTTYRRAINNGNDAFSTAICSIKKNKLAQYAFECKVREPSVSK